MIPQNKTNQNFRKDLLKGSSEPKRTQIYRKGKVANSGASLQPPKPIIGEAGRYDRERAQMIGALGQLLGGKGGIIPQYKEAEKERGIAEWDKATFEQREKWGVAIKNRWVDEKNSPYWREEITTLYTTNLLHKYGQDLFTDYEQWEGKNNPDSGSLTAWFDKQDEKFAINLESIPDNILAKNFYEQQQALKRQITQKHTELLNKEYRDKSYDAAETGFWNILVQNSPAITEDLKDPKSYISLLLNKQRPTEQEYQELARLVTGISKNKEGRIKESDLEELKAKAYKNPIYTWAYSRLTGGSEPYEEGITSPSTEIAEWGEQKDIDEFEKKLGHQEVEATGRLADAFAEVVSNTSPKPEEKKIFTVEDAVGKAAIAVQKARGKDVVTVGLNGIKLQNALKDDKTALNLGTSGLIRPGDGTNKLLERMFDENTGLQKIPDDVKNQLELENWLAPRGSEDREYQESIFQKYMKEKYPQITKGSGINIRIIGKWKKASLSTLDFLEYYHKQGT